MAENISQSNLGEILHTEDMYTKKGVDELLAAAVKGGITPKGSSAFAALPTPAAANVGWMYNVTDAFTTTSAFVEGAGKSYPAGTNIYVCNPSGSTYKWDALPGEGPQPSTTTPKAPGTAAIGTEATFARGDHVHPTDTSRQATITASGLLKGDGSGTVSAAVAGTDYVAPVSGKGLSTEDYTSAEKSKLAGIATGANVGFTSLRIATGENRTLNASANATPELLHGTGLTVSMTSNGFKVDVNLTDSTSDTSTTKAASAKAVKAAADLGSNAQTRVAAIETAAGTLYTALAGLDPATMTTANAIKALVASLLSYVKAFAAAADNDTATSYTAS